MTELAIRPEDHAVTADPTGGRLVAWAGAAAAANKLAGALARTTFVPKHFQGDPDAITAALLLSDELGMPPISGLRSIYIISGTPALYVRAMVALAVSRGHEVWTVESTDAKVTVSGRRRGSDNVETVTWTHDRARKAGYTNNKKYESDPQAMLYARAAGEVARKVAPDVLYGVPYSAEELELAEPEATVKATRTVRRQDKPTAPEPDLPAPVKATAETMATAPQVQKLNILLVENGIADRAEKLSYLSTQTGRAITSSNDLTKAEAHGLIEAMETEDRTDEVRTLEVEA